MLPSMMNMLPHNEYAPKYDVYAPKYYKYAPKHEEYAPMHNDHEPGYFDPIPPHNMPVPHNMTEYDITEQMPTGPHIEVLAPQRYDGPEPSGVEVENTETISNSHRPAYEETPTHHQTPI